MNYKLLNAIMFLFFLAFIVGVGFVSPDKVFSENENRRLQKAPDFSLEDLLEGNFTKKYEKYIADQMPFREQWIAIKAEAERSMGKKENNGVYLAKDGYLLEKIAEIEDGAIAERIDIFNEFASKTRAEIFLALVPKAGEILSDKLPDFVEDPNQASHLKILESKTDKKIKHIDLYSVLKNHREKEIFYKTDHHWTSEGAFYSYQKIMEEMGKKALDVDDFVIEKARDDFYGSLFSKGSFRGLEADDLYLYHLKEALDYSIESEDWKEAKKSVYQLENLTKKDKYTVFLDGNHPELKISTAQSSKPNLLIVKDSFANSLLPFLVSHYHNIFMVDLRYYDGSIEELLAKEKIDEVLIIYSSSNFFEDSTVSRILW